MGRKAKCSSEEKVKAVEDYLNGIRSISEIMDDLSIKSHRSIRDRIIIRNRRPMWRTQEGKQLLKNAKKSLRIA